MAEQKIQDVADKMTMMAMTIKHGSEVMDSVENIEDNPTLNEEWETLNEKFYTVLNSYIN